MQRSTFWNNNISSPPSPKVSGSLNSNPELYLSGVKRKPSASAPSIICSIFWPCGGRWGPSQGRHKATGRSALAKHGWNLAPGQMGILSTRGGWNVAFVGGLLCIGEGGECLSRCQILCSWETYMWCKHAGSWWKHGCQAGTSRADIVAAAAGAAKPRHHITLKTCYQQRCVEMKTVLLWTLLSCIFTQHQSAKVSIKPRLRCSHETVSSV